MVSLALLEDESAANRAYVTETLVGFGILVATLLVMGVGVLLVWFALLRENQGFWTNAGGYPIWLRDLVRLTYMPLFASSVLLLAVLTMTCCSKICASVRFFVLESLILLLCWGLLATSGYISLSNNIMNLIEGRQLHSHQH